MRTDPGVATRDKKVQEPQYIETATAVQTIAVSLLTGGADRPYVFGLGTSLMHSVAHLDLIGSDDLDFPEFRDRPNVTFMNLRGSQRSGVNLLRKMSRVLTYYYKLLAYCLSAKPTIFHILWNNKFETLDRTVLMLYYRCLGKRPVLTVHNVNAGIRDAKDSVFNRLTLRVQYRLAEHLFVHTEQMRRELIQEFGVYPSRVTVIPFGINNAVPMTSLGSCEARRTLGIGADEKTLLFFGHITAYKGLEYLVAAFRNLCDQYDDLRLIIAGKPNPSDGYWGLIRKAINKELRSDRVLIRAEHIPDEDTEVYFKAADVLVMPYRHVYQSGVLFLSYSFGLPVLAADVGALKDEIVEGKTGYVFNPEDPVSLEMAIKRYFTSDLYRNLDSQRTEICAYATKRHSWDVVGQMTVKVYADLMHRGVAKPINRNAESAALDANMD